MPNISDNFVRVPANRRLSDSQQYHSFSVIKKSDHDAEHNVSNGNFPVTIPGISKLSSSFCRHPSISSQSSIYYTPMTSTHDNKVEANVALIIPAWETTTLNKTNQLENTYAHNHHSPKRLRQNRLHGLLRQSGWSNLPLHKGYKQGFNFIVLFLIIYFK